MIVYATHKGGRYLPIEESLREQPEGARNIYVNLTNRCNCACTFCLRNMKEMAEEHTLWLKQEPTVAEVEKELKALPWDKIAEVVFCGFGEPTLRLDALVELLHFVKENYHRIVAWCKAETKDGSGAEAWDATADPGLPDRWWESEE